ncbi:hypothetical protein Tco_0898905 [Tanacetum coccineum]
MFAPCGEGLILYQAYGNLYVMIGRKAHFLEDKKIPSVGVFDDVSFYTLFQALRWHLEEIHVTWAHLEKKRTRLRLYTKNHEELFTQTVDAVATIKRRRQDLNGDGVRNLATASGRGRLKENL